PPVGITLIFGSAPFTFLIKEGANNCPGNNFVIETPYSIACAISFTVIQPGMYGILYLLHNLAVFLLNVGLTINFAPDKIAILAVSLSIIFPAPFNTYLYLYTIFSLFLCAPEIVKLTSIYFTPLLTHASALFSASSSVSPR